jgi:hypothetical protein
MVRLRAERNAYRYHLSDHQDRSLCATKTEMKVRLTLEFPDRYRRAINFIVGRPGRATRADCIAHVDLVLGADASDLCFELDAEAEAKRLRRSWKKP